MADTGLNKKISGVSVKWWLLGGSAAAVTVWYVYKRQQANASVPADTGTAETDTSGYGDFSAAEGGAYASNYGTPSNYGYLDQTTGQFIGVGGTTTVTGPGTNAAWTQQAAAYLIMHDYDPITVITALGKYITGKPVTQDEYNIVTAAIGSQGLPPDGAPPLTMIPPTQTGGGATTGETLPSPVLTIGARTKSKATLRWTAIPGATSYVIYSHASGRPNLPVGGTHGTTTINVPTGHKQSYDVMAIGPGGKHSGHSNGVYIP